MIPFPFNENRFSFFVADHQLVGQLCTNLKSDRSLLSYLKVTQYLKSEMGRSKLWQQDHCQHPQYANLDGSTLEGTAQRIGRPFGRLRLWSLVEFQVTATSCHLTSSKSAWKSTTKCTWICWRVWWSPGAIKGPVADPECGSRTRRRPTSSKRPRLGFRRSVTILYPSFHWLPFSPDLNPLDFFVGSYVENITNMTSHNTKASLITAIRRVFALLPPALVEKACSLFRIRIEAVIEAEGGYIE